MLPQFGFTEFLLIAIVALVVVGPRDLPIMMRRLGQFVAKGKRMANEFRAAFDDIAREAELDELRKEIQDLKSQNAVEEAAADLKSFERDVNTNVMAEQTGAKPAKDTGE
ncbi:MAG: Sec-independent protein translocase protein TatB [Pseudomonadota bacterium]